MGRFWLIFVSTFGSILVAAEPATTKIVSGIYVFGPETESFYYCAEEGRYGMVGPEPLMKPIQDLAYLMVDRHQRMFIPIHIVAEVEDLGPSAEDYWDSYKSIFSVKSIQSINETVPSDCALQFDTPNRLTTEKQP